MAVEEKGDNVNTEIRPTVNICRADTAQFNTLKHTALALKIICYRTERLEKPETLNYILKLKNISDTLLLLKRKYGKVVVMNWTFSPSNIELNKY